MATSPPVRHLCSRDQRIARGRSEDASLRRHHQAETHETNRNQSPGQLASGADSCGLHISHGAPRSVEGAPLCWSGTCGEQKGMRQRQTDTAPSGDSGDGKESAFYSSTISSCSRSKVEKPRHPLGQLCGRRFGERQAWEGEA